MKSTLSSQRVIARIMRAFFYLLYRPLAWSYDYVAAVVSWGRWTDWVLTVLPLLEGPKILEIGHGPGHLQLAIFQKGFQPIGIDTSFQMGRLTRRRLTKQGLKHQLTRAAAHVIPFLNDSFDQVVTTFPTHFIFDHQTLLEINRILKPGGSLLVLPAAWITGKSIMDRASASLFSITGQSPRIGQEWTAPFDAAGFFTQTMEITKSTWALVIIKAQKPGASNNQP